MCAKPFGTQIHNTYNMKHFYTFQSNSLLLCFISISFSFHFDVTIIVYSVCSFYSVQSTNVIPKNRRTINKLLFELYARDLFSVSAILATNFYLIQFFRFRIGTIRVLKMMCSKRCALYGFLHFQQSQHLIALNFFFCNRIGAH